MLLPAKIKPPERGVFTLSRGRRRVVNRSSRIGEPVKKKANKNIPQESSKKADSVPADLTLHEEIANLKKEIQKLTADNKGLQDRVQDIEIHVNLLTRLLTTLCIEKFGMRVGVLKRMIRRIEKEAIRDSQILHLESLYKLSSPPEKKKDSSRPAQDDPWEDIS